MGNQKGNADQRGKRRAQARGVLERPKFSYRELSPDTRGFHCSTIIGNGAFWHGVASCGSKIGHHTVKRSKQAHESKTEFFAELTIIAGLGHKNLVQLQGWCTDRDELLLVYEFMPNGNLDNVLYPRSDSCPCPAFNWERRYNVAAWIASVLAYLRQDRDQRLNGEFDEGDMLRLLLLDLSCVNPNSEERASMRLVIQILSREVEPFDSS